MALGIILVISSIVIFVLAYFLYFKEVYWLISGINFNSRQTAQERYDLPGLTKHCGRMCALIGLVLLVVAVGAFIESELLILISLGSLFVIIPVYLFGSERYLRTGRKAQRIINIVVTVFMTAIAVFVIVMMISGAKAPVIQIEDGNLVIESMYGAEIPLDSIQEIDMVDLSERKLDKLNGFNMDDQLRGRFFIESIGRVMLYQAGEPGISVQIKTADDTYLINLGSKAENEELKEKLMVAAFDSKHKQ